LSEDELRRDLIDLLIKNKVENLVGEVFGILNAICDIKTGFKEAEG